MQGGCGEGEVKLEIKVPSNPAICNELTQQGIHARLPPWATVAQMLNSICVEANFYLHLGSF